MKGIDNPLDFEPALTLHSSFLKQTFQGETLYSCWPHSGEGERSKGCREEANFIIGISVLITFQRFAVYIIHPQVFPGEVNQ